MLQVLRRVLQVLQSYLVPSLESHPEPAIGCEPEQLLQGPTWAGFGACWGPRTVAVVTRDVAVVATPDRVEQCSAEIIHR